MPQYEAKGLTYQFVTVCFSVFLSASNLIIRTLQRAYVMLLYYSLSIPERHASGFYFKLGTKIGPESRIDRRRGARKYWRIIDFQK